MRGRTLVGVFLFGFVCLSSPPPQKKDPPQKDPIPAAEKERDTTADDQKILRDVGLSSDPSDLLGYFKKRTFPEADPKKVQGLIKSLADEDFHVREKAYDDLLHMGSTALVALKQADKSPDTELQRRVLDLRQKIEAKAEPQIQSATARLIARAKPPGAAEVLLNYVPFAADLQVTDEICKALGAVATRDGKVEPAVIQALTDKVPLKRGAAGEAIARAKVAGELPTLRKLLKDADAGVRLRVALSLVPYKEKEIVPVLVEAMGHLSADHLWPAEEILVGLAGDNAPPVSLGTNEAGRKACQEAWTAWLAKHGKDLDLAKLDQPTTMLGYTLLAQQTFNRIGRNFGGQV